MYKYTNTYTYNLGSKLQANGLLGNLVLLMGEHIKVVL